MSATTSFESAQHPRNPHGQFRSLRGMRAIQAAPDAVRFGGAPGFGPLARVPDDDRRSPTRGEGWQRIGNRIAAIPVGYTGEQTRERPVGSYLHLTLQNQIPKSMPVEEHQARVAKYIQLVKDSRKEILEGAEANRPGKKHVYLKAHEPAARGVAKWRMKPDLYPEGTPTATLNRAYNHAALIHMHERGLVSHEFKMDKDLQAELKPTEPFMRYAIARLKQKADIAMPGERAPYVAEFGQPFYHRKNGEATGRISQRLKPNKQLIKANPMSAFRAVAGRAGAALDNLAAPKEAAQSTFKRVDSLANRARAAFSTKAPNTASNGAYTAGRWAAGGAKKFLKNPISATAKGIRHSARLGSGFGQGISDEFGGGARTRRIAGRIGAVSGAVKIPLVAGMAVSGAAGMVTNEARRFTGGNSQQSSGLAKAFSESKHKRDNDGRFSSVGIGAAVGGTLAAGRTAQLAHDEFQTWRGKATHDAAPAKADPIFGRLYTDGLHSNAAVQRAAPRKDNWSIFAGATFEHGRHVETKLNRMAAGRVGFSDQSPATPHLMRGLHSVGGRRLSGLKAGDAVHFNHPTSWTGMRQMADLYAHYDYRSTTEGTNLKRGILPGPKKHMTMLHFDASKRVPMTHIDNQHRIWGQDEHAIPAGAKFKVDKTEDIDGVRHIHLKYTGHDAAAAAKAGVLNRLRSFHYNIGRGGRLAAEGAALGTVAGLVASELRPHHDHKRVQKMHTLTEAYALAKAAPEIAARMTAGA